MNNGVKTERSIETRAIVAIGLAVGLITATVARSAPMPELTDSDVAAAVEREYLRDAAVPLADVDVLVENGVVTVDGEVRTMVARQQAEDLAGIVRGARSVVNRIRLAPSAKAPDALVADVRDAFRADPVAESFEIEVAADSMGRITLDGRVGSWAEKAQVGNVAMSVPGVMDLSNDLTMASADAPRGAGEIAEEIEARLRWDVRVDDSLIDVLVIDGSRVLLSGTVGSLAEKRHAEHLARVAGVRDVRASQLTVEPWAQNDDLRRAGLEPVSDEEIRDAVQMALAYDPRVLREHIDVTVDGGIVHLDGVVESLSARHAAEQDAVNTTGVMTVRNALELTPGIRDDAAIRELVNNAMRGYGLTDANAIEVWVDDGRLRLTGDVHTVAAHWRAEEVAMAVRGVVSVRNDLTINGQRALRLTRLYGFTPEQDRMIAVDAEVLPTDREIRERVQSELYWSPFVDSDDVQIDVDEGVVTLNGSVDSGREYQAAQVNAFQGGAVSVVNDLTLSE